MTHKLKIKEQFVEAILSGNKCFEIRLNDREYQKGDRIKFRVVNDEGKEAIISALTEKTYEITYVIQSFGLLPGYCVFGIKDVTGEVRAEIAEEWRKALRDGLWTEKEDNDAGKPEEV